MMLARRLGAPCRRALSTMASEGEGASEVFDRAAKRWQRDQAARRPDASEFDYLRQMVAQRLVDRIEDIQRDFPLALDVGCHRGHVLEAISAQPGLGGAGGIGGVQRLVQGDVSEACARHAAHAASAFPNRVEAHTLMFDEEHLPFADNTFDLVTSSLALHWVNDVPRALAEISRVLKPDGVFIGALFGGENLTELREALLIGEMEREGGVSVHVSPATRVSDVGGLLTQAGFTLTTVDVDRMTAHFSDMFVLMDELHGMGEQNAARLRRGHVGRDTFLAAAATYHHWAFAEAIEAMNKREAATPEERAEMDLHAAGDERPEWDGECLSTLTVPVTVEVLYMIGWTKHPSQQSPDKRGSATKSLRDISVTKSGPAGGDEPPEEP